MGYNGIAAFRAFDDIRGRKLGIGRTALIALLLRGSFLRDTHDRLLQFENTSSKKWLRPLPSGSAKSRKLASEADRADADMAAAEKLSFSAP